jgi:WD40 repeat protein
VFNSIVANGEIRGLDFDNQTGKYILIVGADRSINILNLEYNKIEGTHKHKFELTGGFFCPSLSSQDNILSIVVSDTEGSILVLDYNTDTHGFV